MGVGVQRHAPAAFTPGKDPVRYVRSVWVTSGTVLGTPTCNRIVAICVAESFLQWKWRQVSSESWISVRDIINGRIRTPSVTIYYDLIVRDLNGKLLKSLRRSW